MYRAVIFDFDYTLGDSTNGIVLSANYALNQLGIVEKSVDEIRKTIGLSLRDTYVSLTGKNDPNPKVVKYVLKTLHLINPYFFQIKGVA